MLVSFYSGYNSSGNNLQMCPLKNKLEKRSNVAFKSVEPRHFFINIPNYGQDLKWGSFVANLANKSKDKVLNKNSTLKKNLLQMARKYHFLRKNKIILILKKRMSLKSKFSNLMHTYFYGIKKRCFYLDYNSVIKENGGFAAHYQKCKKALENNTNFHERKLNLQKTKFSAYQVQDKVDGEDIVLTQIGYRYIKGSLDKSKFYIIHPPAKTGNILMKKAQTYVEQLKPYKNKALSAQDVNAIYEKIGSIHWCLAQGMPFMRGSATLSDVYAKSLFEALNIQVTPWRKGIDPGWESFLTPMDEFSKKYKTFFEP